MKRINALDNLKGILCLMVLIYHIIYIFSPSVSSSPFRVTGIKLFDIYEIFFSTWVMCMFFVISGISTRFFLNKKSSFMLIKSRTFKILMPFIGCIFCFNWIYGLVLFKLYRISLQNLPLFMKYIIYCFFDLGPLWFCISLIIITLIFILFLKITKIKTIKFDNFSSKAMFFILIPFLMHFISICEVTGIYRIGMYGLMFFLGYYVFSDSEIISTLKRRTFELEILSIIVTVIFILVNYGENYCDLAFLQKLSVNMYSWLIICTVLSFSLNNLNFSNKFTEFFKKNSLYIYLIHYPLLLLVVYFVLKFKFKIEFYYILTSFILALILLLLIYLKDIVYKLLNRLTVKK